MSANDSCHGVVRNRSTAFLGTDEFAHCRSVVEKVQVGALTLCVHLSFKSSNVQPLLAHQSCCVAYVYTEHLDALDSGAHLEFKVLLPAPHVQFAHLPFAREPRCSAVEPMLVACCDCVSPSHSTHCYTASTVQFSGALASSRRLCGLLLSSFEAHGDENSKAFRAESSKTGSKEFMQTIPHMAQVIAKCVVLHSFFGVADLACGRSLGHSVRTCARICVLLCYTDTVPR